MQEFLDIIDGRTVAIVGNGMPERDCSEEIDSADIVVRFNHFYNYDSGKVGKRVDVIMQTFTTAWINAKDKHERVIREQLPRIFCAKKPQQYQPGVVAEFLGPVCISDMACDLEPYAMFTTGTAFLMWLASKPRNARFRIYGFPSGEQADRYFQTDAQRYASLKVLELQNRDCAIEMLKRQEIRSARAERLPHIVIPIKAKSSGAPGKNRRLLPILLERLTGVRYPVTVVGDDPEFMNMMTERFGVSKFVVPDSAPDDVTARLRLWRDHTEYSGEVVLLQCTSPNLRVEWIEQVLAARRSAPIAATCIPVNFKINAVYGCANGVWGQIVTAFGTPSVPRQKLPECVRLSGAAWAFHSDALSRESFYQAGTLAPVMIPEDEAVDVDTPEDMARALRMVQNLGTVNADVTTKLPC